MAHVKFTYSSNITPFLFFDLERSNPRNPDAIAPFWNLSGEEVRLRYRRDRTRVGAFVTYPQVGQGKALLQVLAGWEAPTL